MKRVLSKAEETEIAIAYLGSVPIKDISGYYGISRSGIYRVLSRTGHTPTRKASEQHG